MRIAFFIQPLQGHLGPATHLAAALVARGHDCFLVHHPEIVPDAVFRSIAIDSTEANWTPAGYIRHARSSGLPFGVLRLVRDMAAMTDTLCRLGPDLLRAHGIDAVVSDQLEPAGALVAGHLQLPFVTLAAAHPINREPLVPLPVLDWPYEDSDKAIERNRVGAWIADKLTAGHDQVVRAWAERWNLPGRSNVVDCLSPLADITQLVRQLDFPRRALPTTFHYVGPIRGGRPPQKRVKKAPGTQPLVFASLGTLQNHRLRLFQRIAKACRANGVRLILSHANGLSPRQAASIDADEVVPWVDQEQILSQADAVITHGGLNTVLDALAVGLPILCIPLAFEQPGVGARLERAGAGKVLRASASTNHVASALGELLTDPRYRTAAETMAAHIRLSGGAAKAAGIVECAIMDAHSRHGHDDARKQASPACSL